MVSVCLFSHMLCSNRPKLFLRVGLPPTLSLLLLPWICQTTSIEWPSYQVYMSQAKSASVAIFIGLDFVWQSFVFSGSNQLLPNIHTVGKCAWETAGNKGSNPHTFRTNLRDLDNRKRKLFQQ